MKILTLVAYVICVALVVLGLTRARDAVVETFGNETALTEWQKWRTVAGESEGPVERREPKSDLPPAYVLMRDHFNACLGFSLLMTTVLFAAFVFMIRGAFFYEEPAAYQTEVT